MAELAEYVADGIVSWAPEICSTALALGAGALWYSDDATTVCEWALPEDTIVTTVDVPTEFSYYNDEPLSTVPTRDQVHRHYRKLAEMARQAPSAELTGSVTSQLIGWIQEGRFRFVSDMTGHFQDRAEYLINWDELLDAMMEQGDNHDLSEDQLYWFCYKLAKKVSLKKIYIPDVLAWFEERVGNLGSRVIPGFIQEHIKDLGTPHFITALRDGCLAYDGSALAGLKHFLIHRSDFDFKIVLEIVSALQYQFSREGLEKVEAFQNALTAYYGDAIPDILQIDSTELDEIQVYFAGVVEGEYELDRSLGKKVKVLGDIKTRLDVARTGDSEFPWERSAHAKQLHALAKKWPGLDFYADADEANKARERAVVDAILPMDNFIYSTARKVISVINTLYHEEAEERFYVADEAVSETVSYGLPAVPMQPTYWEKYFSTPPFNANHLTNLGNVVAEGIKLDYTNILIHWLDIGEVQLASQAMQFFRGENSSLLDARTILLRAMDKNAEDIVRTLALDWGAEFIQQHRILKWMLDNGYRTSAKVIAGVEDAPDIILKNINRLFDRDFSDIINNEIYRTISTDNLEALKFCERHGIPLDYSRFVHNAVVRPQLEVAKFAIEQSGKPLSDFVSQRFDWDPSPAHHETTTLLALAIKKEDFDYADACLEAGADLFFGKESVFTGEHYDGGESYYTQSPIDLLTTSCHLARGSKIFQEACSDFIWTLVDLHQRAQHPLIYDYNSSPPVWSKAPSLSGDVLHKLVHGEIVLAMQRAWFMLWYQAWEDVPNLLLTRQAFIIGTSIIGILTIIKFILNCCRRVNGHADEFDFDIVEIGFLQHLLGYEALSERFMDQVNHIVATRELTWDTFLDKFYNGMGGFFSGSQWHPLVDPIRIHPLLPFPVMASDGVSYMMRERTRMQLYARAGKLMRHHEPNVYTFNRDLFVEVIIKLQEFVDINSLGLTDKDSEELVKVIEDFVTEMLNLVPEAAAPENDAVNRNLITCQNKKLEEAGKAFSGPVSMSVVLPPIDDVEVASPDDGAAPELDLPQP